jgi:hypothetical protein
MLKTRRARDRLLAAVHDAVYTGAAQSQGRRLPITNTEDNVMTTCRAALADNVLTI